MIFSILTPLLLIGFVLLLGRISIALRMRAAMEVTRRKQVEEFHLEAMRFIKATDPHDHEKLRSLVEFLADRMMDGSRLVRTLMWASKRGPTTSDADKDSMSALIEGLEDKTKHSLAKLLALALLVSASSSLFNGRKYMALLELLLSSDAEVREPEQIVYRFDKAGVLPSWNQPSPC